jgi:hypothetical protein
MNVHPILLAFVASAALATLVNPAGPRPTAAGHHVAARRVLVVTDMEGISGVNDGRMGSTADQDTAYYAAGLDRLHADVNATIAGLFDGGATAVDVADTRQREESAGASTRPRARLIHCEARDGPESRCLASCRRGRRTSQWSETSGRVTLSDEGAQANATDQGWAARHLPDEPSTRRLSILEASGHRVPW